jgi:hypothetical protein
LALNIVFDPSQPNHPPLDEGARLDKAHACPEPGKKNKSNYF